MPTQEIDIMVSAGGLLDELESAGNKVGATIYNICHRNAGWAIQWHESKKQGESDNWKDGLIIHRYYPKLIEAIQAEFIRIGGTCPECDSEILPDQFCMMGHWCGEPANR